VRYDVLYQPEERGARLKGPHPHRLRAILAQIALLATLLCPRAAAGQEMSTPIDIQLPLMSRILMFDRANVDRAGEETVVGVLYQERFRASTRARDDVVETIRSQGITEFGGSPLRLVLIEAEDDPVLLATRILETGVDLLYVTPLRAFDLDTITDIGRQLQVLTVTGVPGYVSNGIAVGVDSRGGRPQILINRGAARDQGADFSSELLKLAEIVGPELRR